jgi:hypothetical protein
MVMLCVAAAFLIMTPSITGLMENSKNITTRMEAAVAGKATLAFRLSNNLRPLRNGTRSSDMMNFVAPVYIKFVVLS